jgi:amino acid adenylation domain-containing protein
MSIVDSYAAMASRASFHEPETIHDLVNNMACACPQQTFLIGPETRHTVTFAGLQQHANHLLVSLRQIGLCRGDKVAFLLDNSLFTTQLFLGLMYGGFVVVPLNVAAGVSQLSYTLEHSDSKVVYVAAEYNALLESVMANVRRPIHIIPVDLSAAPVLDQQLAISPNPAPPRPEDPALLVYTSGSTGQPKAAVHTHQTILAHGRNSISSHQLTSADRSLLVLPIYHINAECVTLIPTLMSGGSVVVPRRFNVTKFWDWLEEFRCTWSAVVPTIVSQLLDWQDPRRDQRQTTFDRIRFLRSSSAPLAPSLHREFLDKFNLLLIQAMGSSEGGNVFSNPLPPRENKVGSVGLPWGFEAKIINRDGIEVPQGEPGEVLLRGPGLTRSYYKEPEATAAAFDAEGWFHTGDLAYRDSDGYFHVVGRSKELIIKGGVNIAPRQIDEALESHPAVLEAAAVGVPDRLLGEDIVAFVVPRAGAKCEENEMLAFCAARLGHFKTPTRIHFVTDLPKGPSGKVQRLRLREDLQHTDFGQSARASELQNPPGLPQVAQQPPSTDTASIEQIIAGTWAELLSQPQIDWNRSFFELGGHSLLAMQCVSRLRERIPVALTVSEFFESGTVTQLAAAIRQRIGAAGASETDSRNAESNSTSSQVSQTNNALTPAIPVRDQTLPCPLSPGQRRLWFIEQLSPELPLYNEAEAVRLTGELNIAALERAINVVVTRHDSLRTTFEMQNNEPAMLVHASWPLRLNRVDLSSLAPQKRAAELDRLLIEEPRRLFHLEKEPGIRLTLVCLGSREHVLILMMHHIISDRSSFGVFWREMAAVYRALCRGESFALPTSPIQFPDYAAWLSQRSSDTQSAGDLAFWMENLRGAPAILGLPSDRPRPLTISYRGAKQRFRLDSTLSTDLRTFSRRQQASLFTLFAAAWNAVLYRYTGQEDLLVGIPIADRERSELRSLIGFLVDTQVLRTQVSANMSFIELLYGVRRGILEVYRHRSVPFDQVVQHTQTERKTAYAPLFQVMINWRDRDLQLPFIGLEGLDVEPLLAESRTSKNDLTLFVTDAGEQIHLEFEYNTDLFDADRIQRMSEHMRVLLEAVLRNPAQHLARLPVLTAQEEQQLLVDWNATEREYPSETPLAALVESQVERTPDAVAVIFGESSISYRDLNARANRLAHQLRKQGAGPDQLVGVCMERSIDMVVALLAVIKAGAAYVPLDPDLPAERLNYIIHDSEMPILLTQQSLRNSVSAVSTFRGTAIDLDNPLWQSHDSQNPAVAVTPQNLAYVIYTSGSTGKPKGVAVPRKALTNFLWSMKDWLKPQAGQASLAATTISFDIAGLEIWLPLLVGAHIVMVDHQTAANGQELASVVKQHDIRMAQATPVTWRLLLSSSWPGKPDLLAICGGEALPRELASQLRPLVGCLWNLYGPTESTIWSTGTLVDEADQLIAIGRPIANTQCYILDQQQQPVPIGVVGELYIAGDGLANGYLNRPQLTETKFLPNPFISGQRMYRTGDLARYRRDGRIECLGRTDHQVKLRGYLIELAEIESILDSHPGIRQSVVVKREDRAEDTRLVAYFVPDGETVPDRAELRALLKRSLPDYMIPSDYVPLDSLPTTPNGKVDRLALPDAKGMNPLSNPGYVPPRNEFERLVCEVWAQVLGVERVGIRDNFFELGGHSLLALRLMLRLQKVIPGETLPLRAILEASTVQQFLTWLGSHKTNDNQFIVPLRPGTSHRPPFFCVHGAGGNVLSLRSLAMALPQDLPIYCFEDKGLDGSDPFQTIEQTAQCYIAELRGVQPHGPYHIAGACFGGYIAFEMARQLQASGEPVAALVLIDSFNHTFVKSLSRHQRFVRNARFSIQRLAWHARNVISQSPADSIPYMVGRFAALRTRLLSRQQQPLPGMAELGPECPTDFGQNWQRIVEADRAALNKFQPQPYSGDALLFRAGRRDPSPYDDQHMGWKPLIRGKIDCFEIEADHPGILEQPAVQLMADKLNAMLLALSPKGEEPWLHPTTTSPDKFSSARL